MHPLFYGAPELLDYSIGVIHLTPDTDDFSEKKLESAKPDGLKVGIQLISRYNFFLFNQRYIVGQRVSAALLSRNTYLTLIPMNFPPTIPKMGVQS